MQWVFIGLIILAIAINITSFLVFKQAKRQRAETMDDRELIQQSMKAFVENLEKENDELYRELVNYIKSKEKKLDERIRVLEEKPVAEVAAKVAAEPVPESQEQEPKPAIPGIAAGEEKEKIPQLYKQGFSPKQIARVLQIDHGEVELIINMFNKKQSYQK